MTGSITNKSASSWLTVDLGALAANYNLFKDKAAPGCRAAAVIKADAYGLGAEKALAALENRGCPFYFVATPEEGSALRRLTQKPLAVLSGLYKGAESLYIHENLIPVLNSLEEIARWQKKAVQHQIPLRALVHFDTGMNRLGLGVDETAALHAEPGILKGLEILYMMSHFACADEKDHPMTVMQYARFMEATALFPAVKRSLANSAGAFCSPTYHFDLLRPGMALYGLNPTPWRDNPMKPVVTLRARILQVRAVKKGDTAGYGASYRFEKDGYAATVALGYADGFLRSLGNRGKLYYGDAACPIAGRVSMDAVIVDTGFLERQPVPGESMEVIGSHQDADSLAKDAGTIGYEILTSLGRRYYREYRA